jgi:hypothetical protein
MKSGFLIAALCLLVSCSSTPEKTYQVSDYEQASLEISQLADRKRQQHLYEEASELYLRAEEFALMRNDQHLVGINKLKRAQIHIFLDQAQQAETLIGEVELANRVEQLKLEQAISFVRAKLLLKQGETAQAFALIAGLEDFYSSDSERQTYYRLLRWSYDYSQFDPLAVQQMVDGLTALYDARELQNIEILSFSYFEHARWAVDNASLEQGQQIIELSIDHFSRLELTPRIASSLEFAADFYARLGIGDRSTYYRDAYHNLVPES